MRTAAWYGDLSLELSMPREWDVKTVTPRTPAPLPVRAIAEALYNPVGQTALPRLAEGKRRPVVIIDDLNRPTPTDRILPFVLACFPDPNLVTVVVATGTHGTPSHQAVRRKTGDVRCRVVVHDPKRGEINPEVAASDFVIGIGGIYPNHTAGFGGGSKLALGVLGFRQIEALHYRHGSAGWGSSASNGFRAELDDIARRIGLFTVISAHVNADRELVRITSGDHFRYHAIEAEQALRMFGGPEPGEADLVISNAYPNDLSLTFARMKGMTPLSHCATGVSRVAIAACPEGLGLHGLFPLNPSRRDQLKSAWRKIARVGPRALTAKIASKVQRGKITTPKNQVWVYRPGEYRTTLPERAGELRITHSWNRIVEAVRAEHPGKARLRVLIYPCAPLQPLKPAGSAEKEHTQCLLTA